MNMSRSRSVAELEMEKRLKCKLCEDFTFNRFDLAERHIIEQHSGFAWKCRSCCKIWSRKSAHNDKFCNRRDLVLFERSTGEMGRGTEERFRTYKSETMPRLIVEQRSLDQRKVVDDRGRQRERQERSSRKRRRVESPLRSVDLNLRSRSPPVEPQAALAPSNTSPRSPTRSASSSSSSSSSSSGSDSTCRSLSRSPSRGDKDKSKEDEHETATTVLDLGLDEADEETTLNAEEDALIKEQENVQKQRIVLDVGGTKFTTSRVTLRKHGNSLLAILSSKGADYLFIDRDPAHFRHILNYYRYDEYTTVFLPRDYRFLKEMETEARFYRLPELLRTVKSKLNMFVQEKVEI